MWALQHVTGLHIMDNNKHRQDAQKGLQQGRSKRRGEEVQTALRVGRSPLQWILANGKAPPVLPTSEHLNPYVEPLSEARTKRAGFFSILVDKGVSVRLGSSYHD